MKNDEDLPVMKFTRPISAQFTDGSVLDFDEIRCVEVPVAEFPISTENEAACRRLGITHILQHAYFLRGEMIGVAPEKS